MQIVLCYSSSFKFSFIESIRTMLATIFTTISSLKMVLFCKDDIPIFTHVVVIFVVFVVDRKTV